MGKLNDTELKIICQFYGGIVKTETGKDINFLQIPNICMPCANKTLGNTGDCTVETEFE